MKRSIFVFFFILSTVFTFWACNTEDPWSPYKSEATLSQTNLGWDERTITLTTSGDSRLNWEAAIVEGYEWASFSDSIEQITKKGKVGTTAKIYLSKNETTVSRSATVHIRFSDDYIILKFEQLGMSENAAYDRAWAEQPAMTYGEELIHKTYYTTLSKGNYVRNYSICYDTDKLVSRWVAYPLHNCYVNPSLGRTDAWSFDPALPENIQQNKTRNNVCADTLYVVVGTLFEDGRTFTSRGRTIARPSHCYKLLLRTKNGNTEKSISQITDASEIKAIGFLFENEASATTNIKSAAVSIAEIEKRAGVTFFRNLDRSIAEQVKSQKKISDWNF